MAANFRNRISMEPMRSHAHGVKGAPFFSLGGGGGVSSCVWCGEWTVPCSFSTHSVDSHTFQANLFQKGDYK